VSTVLICDDHRIVREGLKYFVEAVAGVERVAMAATGEEVLARYDLERPDLVLMDVQLPGLGSLETMRRLLKAHPGARVVMLTAAGDREQFVTAVANGATGYYLLKDVSGEQPCATVADALAGRDLVAPPLRRAMAERAGTARPGDPAAALTERELQVLRGMAAGRANAQIARSLSSHELLRNSGVAPASSPKCATTPPGLGSGACTTRREPCWPATHSSRCSTPAIPSPVTPPSPSTTSPTTRSCSPTAAANPSCAACTSWPGCGYGQRVESGTWPRCSPWCASGWASLSSPNSHYPTPTSSPSSHSPPKCTANYGSSPQTNTTSQPPDTCCSRPPDTAANVSTLH